MLIYNLFILTVVALLYIDYATNLKITYRTQRFNINSFAIFLALSAVVIFAGLRYEIGYDYTNYLAGFLFDSELEQWEPLFNFFTRIIREVNFGLDSQAIILFFSILTLSIVYIAIKKFSPYYRTSVLLYLLIPALYLNSFSVIRQGIAMAILFYALYFLTVKIDRRKYLLLGFVAFMFHYSSIFIVIIYLSLENFFNRTYSWIVYMTGIGISIFLYITGMGRIIVQMLPGHFSVYTQWDFKVSILKLLIVNAFFIFLMLQKKQFVHTRFQRFALNSIFLATVIFNVFADLVFVTRIAQYFLIVEIVLVPMYIYSFRSKLKQQVVLVGFLAYYMFNFNYAIYRDIQYNTGNQKHFLVPYENYLTEDVKSDKQKYQQRWIEYWHEIGVLK